MADNSTSRPSSATTASTTTTTTTTHGPRTVTSTYTSADPNTIVTSSAPQTVTTTHPTVITTSHLQVPQPSYRAPSNSTNSTNSTNSGNFSTPAASTTTQPRSRPSSIRIRRQGNEQAAQTLAPVPQRNDSGRRRSSSDPQRSQLAPFYDDLEIRRQTTATPLQTLQEEGPDASPHVFAPVPPAVPPRNPRRPLLGRQFSLGSFRGRGQDTEQDASGQEPLYDTEIIDMLDVIDPEVSTLTTLNNVQNSLFIPNLGWLYRRQPIYSLSAASPVTSSDEENEVGMAQGDAEKRRQPGDGSDELEQKTGQDEEGDSDDRPEIARMTTISSVLTGMSEGHNYAVLPHGASLPGWSDEEKAALNDHVRHLLHSRREKFKRSMRGFGRYVRKPVGFLVSLYAFLLTFWGAAWVLFLIGWISVEGRQAYFIEICDQILTALFCVVGIGLAPWRAVDTYHMIYIAHYAHLTWRLRRERGLPALQDHNELPARPKSHSWEADEPGDPAAQDIVLTAEQQRKLEYHQAKFANSHSFYKPHETSTHRAFSLRLLIAIVVLLDCHSLFQMALGGTTWGIYYKVRPKALTAVILSCSITCNISAGITITVGDKRSRKKLVIEQMFRQGVTEEALKHLRKERGLKAKGIPSEKDKEKHKEKETS